MRRTPSTLAALARLRRGSVLIIVLWVCLGLVALTLYFANSMSSELRAADNRALEIEARQAVAGGTRYAAYILSQFGAGGRVPDVAEYQAEALPVGEAYFWFIGRDQNVVPTSEPVFGLVDEASKLNLNTASRSMLEMLPGMTPELVDAIISWRHAATDDSTGGDTGNTYAQLDPPRLNKGALFETVDELRLVYGATLDILFGEDTNRNGALDPNEDDGELSAPRDDQNGLLLPGVLEYLTVYSRQPSTRTGGGKRANITTAQTRQGLKQILISRLDPERAQAILNNVGNDQFANVAEFMLASRMTPDEFAQIHTDVTGSVTRGLINVNTASETVLACIPGIGPDNAGALVAYRLANPDVLTSFAWLTQILNPGDIRRAGPYITDQSYQFSADIAGVGRFARGYCREKVIFDMSNGTPRIVYHQDLSSYGWALGAQARLTLKGVRQT